MKTPLPIAKVKPKAEEILSALQPFCDRIEIAGSIRRERPLIGDIDLVALPAAGQANALRARILQNKEIVINGPLNVHVRLGNGLEVNVFLATPASVDLFAKKPTNFGALLLTRTGSREHNIWIAQRAQRLGYSFNPQWGVFCDGRCLASATEEDIFRALDLDFVQPKDRER